MTPSRAAMLDAIVIGSGPNGLAAAVALARAGRSVRVYEAQATIGGATRSLPLTEPGFVHDVCATVHALVAASPFLNSLPLADFGYELVHAPVPFAHPLDDGTAVVDRKCAGRGKDPCRHDAGGDDDEHRVGSLTRARGRERWCRWRLRRVGGKGAVCSRHAVSVNRRAVMIPRRAVEWQTQPARNGTAGLRPPS